MNKRQSPANGDSAVTLFGPGDYCALTYQTLSSVQSVEKAILFYTSDQASRIELYDRKNPLQ